MRLKSILLQQIGIWSLLFLLSTQVFAQNSDVLEGWLVRKTTQIGIAGAEVAQSGSNDIAITDERGYFRLSTEADQEVTLIFTVDGRIQERTFEISGPGPHDLGIIQLALTVGEEEDEIFTVTLADEESGRIGDQNISGLLSASRDAFASAAAFVFGPARFRVRGFDAENAEMNLNGVPYNELENGRPVWAYWGGLNDVTRNREAHLGATLVPFGFGGIGGATQLDLRASRQRAQKRVTYSLTNRNYRNRLMGTWSTGMMPGDWAVSISASKRWADEGYIPGTFYDAYGYFLSVDKKLNDKHLLNFVTFGTPSKRGRNGPAIQEMFDIAGTNYYNPYWGYQEGEKRNARVANGFQPIFMLRHDWTMKENTVLTTAASYQTGRYGTSALDWYKANDPRPDYYRRLPSFMDDPDIAAQVRSTMENDENQRQIQWQTLYETNLNSMDTIFDANGIPGNEMIGRRSHYIIEERRYDSDKFNLSTNLQQVINDRVSLYAGANYRWYHGETFKTVDDLLGGEFYVDWNNFAERDSPNDPIALQNDLNIPNRILSEGDVFGYSYDVEIRNFGGWVQTQLTLPKFDVLVGGNLSYTKFWRDGNFRNGQFPESSFGESEKFDFTNYGAKLGLTYKIDGRNYVYANGMYMTRAPFFRNSFVSPRTRNQAVPDLKSETIRGGEFGYTLRAPRFKARLTGFYTEFLDQTITRSFFHDDERSFVNFSQTNIDKQHVGVEGFVDVNIGTGLSATAVASVGQYLISSRPTATVTQDNNAEVLDEITIYSKNFYVSGTPQSVYTFGLRYQSKDYWTVYLNFNYLDRLWIDYNPVRRTAQGVDLVEENSPLWDAIINQEQGPSEYTVNASIFKSFAIDWFKERTYLRVNFSINNLLDNQDYQTGGFEQLRYNFENKDPNTFPAKYYYFQGLNYYFNVSFSF